MINCVINDADEACELWNMKYEVSIVDETQQNAFVARKQLTQ